MYIVDSATVNASAKDSIAISTNNIDWDYIDKFGITKITGTYIANVKSSVANRGYKHNDLAVVEIFMKDNNIVKFDVQDVANQTSWNTAAATVRAGLNKALLDLQIFRSTHS